MDDVYSGGEPDGVNPLLSEAMEAGFLHPRCKDGFTTYFPGISSAPDPATRGEVREAVEEEKRENRERYVQRQAGKYERLEKYSLDEENRQRYEARAEEWEERLKPSRAEPSEPEKVVAEADKQLLLRKESDPIYKELGPALKSHPDEIRRIVEDAKSAGVEVISHPGAMSYAPGLRRGQPGQLHISETDSYGAWIHEAQHMYDDQADGWPGFSGLFDVDRRSRMEYNAYRKEIELALSMGRDDLAQELRQMCKNEIERFGGVWDETRLP